ncbi:hypothetical protein [Rahnella sp. PCH160]|uniref:hypothetical protein n=1 Tax=Rahnella sp. PCH160 TaxID=3447928 RepID=UPI0039FCD57A
MKILNENKYFAGIIVFYFILCVGYYLGSDLGLFPDENPHLGYVLDVAKYGFPDYATGMIYDAHKLNSLEHPALYYMLVGGVKKIALTFNLDLYKSLRFVNIFISTLTIATIYLSLKEFGVKKIQIALSLLILLSIPMFILLSASINNDPLNFLGCALIFLGLAKYYNNAQLDKVVLYFILGGIIVSLTKATGALSVICIIFTFVIIENNRLKIKLPEISFKYMALIALSLILIITYYLFTFIKFGKMFPAPQGDPSDWYKLANPNAHRFTVSEQLIAFYQSNLLTLITPYGHKTFYDLEIRENLLKLLFFLFSFITVLFTLKNIKNRSNSNEARFNFVCVFSFLIFMFFYFITIHKMNLKTGYPGAMQARYFFGFLPAFIIISALNYQKIRIKILKATLIFLIFLTSMLSIYPAYQPIASVLLSPSYGQIWSDTVVGELTKDRAFEQTFTSQYNNLGKVDLYMATYSRINSGVVILEVEDGFGRIRGSSTLNLADIRDNSWTTFDFGNIPLIKGEKYKFRLTSQSSTSGNAITWYACSGKYQFPMFAGTPFGPSEKISDRYTGGQSYIDGKKVDTIFTFKIYGENWLATHKNNILN